MQEVHLSFSMKAGDACIVQSKSPLNDFERRVLRSDRRRGSLAGNLQARWRRLANTNDVSRLAGRPVRLRFVMQAADLFSIRFRPRACGKEAIHGIRYPRWQVVFQVL